ncbi:hypothetical protein [Bacillus pumilus]|uniref:hypothetical protein n=1 Tax=Bacillus pumilus TaxID=1408 RepID=UPI00119EF85A|nr:hypothetical protein [Bacillus pumilus]
MSKYTVSRTSAVNQVTKNPKSNGLFTLAIIALSTTTSGASLEDDYQRKTLNETTYIKHHSFAYVNNGSQSPQKKGETFMKKKKMVFNDHLKKEKLWIEDGKNITPVKELTYFEDYEMNVDFDDFTEVDISMDFFDEDYGEFNVVKTVKFTDKDDLEEEINTEPLEHDINNEYWG